MLLQVGDYVRFKNAEEVTATRTLDGLGTHAKDIVAQKCRESRVVDIRPYGSHLQRVFLEGEDQLNAVDMCSDIFVRLPSKYPSNRKLP